MIAYAESSAVLRWLLGTPDGARLKAILSAATEVVTSSLTGVEIARSLRRAVATGVLSAREREVVWQSYAASAVGWQFHAVTDELLERAADSFPDDHIRTLDAIHLATALHFTRAVAPVTVVSVDERLRRNAAALGLGLAPA